MPQLQIHRILYLTQPSVLTVKKTYVASMALITPALLIAVVLIL